MNSEDWRDEQRKQIDLQLENEALADEITLRGATISKCEDIDPEIENQFLKDVIAFEDAYNSPEVPLRSFFPSTYQFPPAESLTDRDLSLKLEEISSVLSDHNIELGYNNNVPDRVLYKHLVEDFIPNEMIQQDIIEGFTYVLDGCTGDCSQCFQKDYCSTAQENLS